MGHESKSCEADYPSEGRYANYFRVGYNAFEFLFDFGQLHSENQYPESQPAKIHTRIITNPIYAKALLKTIQESVEQFEQTFRVISERDD